MTTPSSPPDRRALLLHALTLVAFIAASSTPTPLYRLYQQAWQFSPFLLTVIFAVYSLSLLTALLCFGTLSDHLGRKPVILGALALEIAAMTLFLVAQDVGWLIAARLLQGFATGLATASLGAALIDADHGRGAFINSIAPMAGLGIGALGSALLVRYAPAPLHFGFLLLAALFAAQTVRTALTPRAQAASPTARWRLRPRIAVPAAARAPLLAITPISIAIWALGGFYLSLMPSLLRDMAGADAAWMGGTAVALLSLSAAASIALAGRLAPRRNLLLGATGMLAGTAVLLTAIDLMRPDLILAGSVLTGLGGGVGFLGAVRSLIPHAQPQERAGLMAAYYLECYLSNAAPALIAGFAATHLGLEPTALVFGLGIFILAALSLAVQIRRPARP